MRESAVNSFVRGIKINITILRLLQQKRNRAPDTAWHVAGPLQSETPTRIITCEAVIFCDSLEENVVKSLFNLLHPAMNKSNNVNKNVAVI